MSKKICFIGAGNLATHLSQALQEAGHQICQVYSRTERSAKELALILKCNYTNNPKNIRTDVDVCFIATSDSAVAKVLQEIGFQNWLIVHCSGSLPIGVLDNFSAKTGVFYPLQTFSKNRKVNFGSIPVFIEANSKKSEKTLVELAKQISGNVSVLNSEKRKSLHISAVFACNFVNHMYVISANILQEDKISFDVLKPLVLETALKILEMHPEKAQTGPAVRFDKNIISGHLKKLEGMHNYGELYNSISKSIFEYHIKTE